MRCHFISTRLRPPSASRALIGVSREHLHIFARFEYSSVRESSERIFILKLHAGMNMNKSRRYYIVTTPETVKSVIEFGVFPEKLPSYVVPNSIQIIN